MILLCLLQRTSSNVPVSDNGDHAWLIVCVLTMYKYVLSGTCLRLLAPYDYPHSGLFSALQLTNQRNG